MRTAAIDARRMVRGRQLGIRVDAKVTDRAAALAAIIPGSTPNGILRSAIELGLAELEARFLPADKHKPKK